jgi:hypothetical protein
MPRNRAYRLDEFVAAGAGRASQSFPAYLWRFIANMGGVARISRIRCAPWRARGTAANSIKDHIETAP